MGLERCCGQVMSTPMTTEGWIMRMLRVVLIEPWLIIHGWSIFLVLIEIIRIVSGLTMLR